MQTVLCSTHLEDLTSPHQAYYMVSLKQVVSGYVIEKKWGGKGQRLKCEQYFRGELKNAQQHYDRLLALRFRSTTRRRYRVALPERGEQLSLF